jgi:predicted ATPase
VEFDNGQNGYSATLKLGTDGFVFTNEKLIIQRDSNVDISSSDKEARLKITDNYRAKHVIEYLNGFRKYHFHDTSDKSPFTKSNHIQNDTHYLYSDGSNLAAFLFEIKNNDKVIYNLIISTIQSIAPYFLDFELTPNKGSFIELRWKDKYSDTIYGVTDLSDGTIRFIALTVLFLQPNLPDTIIIDEPELGLHPTAISKLAGMIKSASLKGSQVIVATQSTDLISHFSPDDIITVDQIDGCSKFNYA